MRARPLGVRLFRLRIGPAVVASIGVALGWGCAATGDATRLDGNAGSSNAGSSKADGGAADDSGTPGSDVAFERLELSREFWSEGAALGDLDGDGFVDAVSGPFVYRGPSFDERFELYAPRAAPFDPTGYSDNFFAFVVDLNADAQNDVLVVGFPGEGAHWYENPGQLGEHWTRHLAFASVDAESPHFTDLTGDGRPELVLASGGLFGWAEPAVDPRETWSFHPLSAGTSYGRFTHGLGVGDVDGDGRRDVLEAAGYYSQPESLAGDPVWSRTSQPFGSGGAQMFAYDVDGDGDQDVITSLAAHGYGVAWYERRGGASNPSYAQHLMAGEAGGDAPGGVVLHEPHALALADVNGDGLLDVVAGERFWGHYPGGDARLDDPALLYWFELVRGAGGAQLVPHRIDDASGVGTQLTTGDADGDGRTDVLIANKKGTFLFLQRASPPDAGR